MAASFQCCTGIRARSSALQRPHFFPKVRPSGAAQTAHCVRIILYMVKSSRQLPTTTALEVWPAWHS